MTAKLPPLKFPKKTNTETEMRRIDFLLCEIYDWADENPNFDLGFVDSLQTQFEENRTLSQKQMQALENIYDGTVNRF